MYSQRIKEKRLSWGAHLLAAPFSAYGSVSIVGSVRGGARAAGSETFAKIHADMLLEGTRRRTKKELQEKLDSMSASLSFSADTDRLVFSGRVMAEHLDPLLALIAEILREPSFPARELALLKQREAAALALQAQDTRAQAGIALTRLIYAPGHPNYEETTDESKEALAGLTPKKLRDHHTKNLDGASIVLSLAGDIAPAKAFVLGEKHFKTLPRGRSELPPFAPSTRRDARSVSVFVPHKANIDYMLGTAAGITKDHPDYPALLLGVQILGLPGFLGRLMKIVREKEGLTYGIYAYASGFDRDVDGYLAIWATFAPELFERGKSSALREIRTLVSQGATAEEVRRHRERYAAEVAVRLSNSGAFAAAAHSAAADGRPLSYIDEFPKRIARLTPREVNRAVKKYLAPERLSAAAAGPTEKNAAAA